jgi:hypothetical protein
MFAFFLNLFQDFKNIILPTVGDMPLFNRKVLLNLGVTL